MKIFAKMSHWTLAAVASSALLACTTLPANTQTDVATTVPKSSQLLATLPLTFNSPASFSLDANNNVLFTSPNLHNDLFVKQGLLKQAATPRIGAIDAENNISTWYVFSAADMEPTSKTVVPMGIAMGPDGHMYVADMQLWAGGESRILRINVAGGKATGVDVVAKGFSFPNAVAWRGNDLFISDTVLSANKGEPTVSGVYRVNLKELNAKQPLQISAYSANSADSHLIKTFQSNGNLGFGANGLAVDGNGNLYTGIMEDGTVFKTQLDDNNNPLQTTLFTQGLVAPDGIQWDKNTNALYTTDLFANAVYRITMQGELELLAKNGDTDGANGELDGPGEVIVRGNRAIVNNFDAAFGVPTMVNTKPDAPVTLSWIRL